MYICTINNVINRMDNLIEIRWHGRGGQGAKTASLLLADAAFNTGKYIQGFPEYDKIDNPNWYVDWNQRSLGYFGVAGSIIGDPFLYRSSEETTFLE